MMVWNFSIGAALGESEVGAEYFNKNSLIPLYTF
jgi:hypothetical protein